MRNGTIGGETGAGIGRRAENANARGMAATAAVAGLLLTLGAGPRAQGREPPPSQHPVLTPRAIRLGGRGSIPPSPSLAVSPDGNTLAVGGFGNRLTLWDLTTGELRTSFAGSAEHLPGGGRLVGAFSPDGKLIITGSGGSYDDVGQVKLWEARTGRLLRNIRERPSPMFGHFSADGRTVVCVNSGERHGSVELWRRDTRRVVEFAYYDQEVFSAELSPDNRTLMVTLGQRYEIFDVPTRRSLWVLGDSAHADLSPDGRWVACDGPRGAVRLREARIGRLVRSFGRHRDDVTSVAFSPDGRMLASCSRDGRVKLWRVATGRLIRTLRGPWRGNAFVSFSADGRRVMVHAWGGGLHLWHPHSGRHLRLTPDHASGVESVTTSPARRLLITANQHGLVRLWHADTGNLRVTLVPFSGAAEHGGPGEWLAFTPEGHYTGSPGVERHIQWRVSGQVLPGDAYGVTRRQPEQVRAALRASGGRSGSDRPRRRR
jgi:WD40 repeat protein